MDTIPETPDNYWNVFNSEIVKIKEYINRLTTEKKDNHEDICLSDIKQHLSRIQKYATCYTGILPSYDIRRSQEVIEGCNREFTALEALVKPKKKFAFSKNKKNLSQPTTTATNESGIPLKADHTAQTINCNADIDAISTNPKPTGAFEVLGSFSLFERSNEKLFLCNKSSEDDSSNGSDLLKIKIESNCQLLIKGCDSCTIRVEALLGSVRIETSKNCTILLSPCCTSVYLENVNNCNINIACHQLRIHDSHNCKLYVRVNSHPIIEDCSSMGFAPYRYNYQQFDVHLKLADLIVADNWNNVVDFRWHKHIQSPNWYVIEEEKQNLKSTIDEVVKDEEDEM